MPFTAPTVETFKARFPRFASVDNAVVQTALDEAAGRVDETWIEGDFTMARMLYAAHVLTLDGHGSGAESVAAAEGASGFRRMRSGSLDLERFSTISGGSTEAGVLDSTSYGRRFRELLRRSFPGVAVAVAS